MTSIFSTGPIETEEGPAYMLTAFEGNRGGAVKTGTTQLAALELWVDELGADGFVACPELAQEAEALGVAVGVSTGALRRFRALQAVLLIHFGRMPLKVADELESFMDVFVSFLHAEPWTWIDREVQLRASYQERGQRAKSLLVSVTGGPDEGPGLVLRSKPRTPRASRKRRDRKRADDSLLLCLHPEPRWAVEAMGEGFGVFGVPQLCKICRGQSAHLEAGDLRQLEAVLHCVSLLAPDQPTIEADTDDELGAYVRVELPRSKPRQREVAVSRNAPCPCGSGRKYKRCCLSEKTDEPA